MSETINQPESTDLIVERSGALLTLVLNRPDSFNALSPKLVESIITAIDAAAQSSSDPVRLCVFKANGKNFCAGFDLSDLQELSDGDLLLRFVRIETMLQKVHHAPFPVMALAHGHVVGAGADLFAACWCRVATSNAKYKMPGWQFELALGTRRLTSLVGQDAARDMLIDTRTVEIQRALDIGLASECAEVEDWPALVESTLARCASLPASATRQLLQITANDTRSEDMASIAITAGVPGLKQRILDYRQRLQDAKKKR